jgi:hypothetical protein
MVRKLLLDSSPQIQQLIELGCDILRSQKKPNISEARREVHKRTGTNIPYHTLHNRFLGKTRPAQEAHVTQQLLSPEAEKVLVDWIIFLSNTRHPLSRRTIRKKAEAICGKVPSAKWIYLSLAQHPDIKLGKPSGLDPKQAWAFNHPVASHHFDLLRKIVAEHQIPVKNIYNMDEKGCQRGGGR